MDDNIRDSNIKPASQKAETVKTVKLRSVKQQRYCLTEVSHYAGVLHPSDGVGKTPENTVSFK